jgi:hypothetical protein
MAVLYLDADDEITSAAARIRDTEDERIAIVLPFGSRLATSRINFRLLAREATEHGKAIEIVAADASARALATSAGLIVHPSVAAFEGGPGYVAPAGDGPPSNPPGSVPGRPPTTIPLPSEDDAPTSVILVPRESAARVPVVGRARPPVRPGAAVGIGLAVVAAIAVLGLLAFTLLPSASIVLAPWSETIGPLTADVVARTDVTAPNATTLQVPARQFSFDVAVSQTFTTTGVKVTEAKASGSVTFQNCDTGGSVTIPAGARVATAGGVGFLTQARITIKRANVFPFSCRTGDVNIEAEKAGTDGNVGAGQITKIPPGFDPIVLSVTNASPTAGGVHDETPQISQADIDTALAALNAALPAELDRQVGLGTGIPSGMTLYPETKQIGTTTPTVDPKTLLGLAQPQFELGLSTTGTVLGVDAAPIRSVALERLRTHVVAEFTLDEASIAIDIGAPSVIGDTVSFPITVQARQVRHVDQAALLESIRGLDLPAARARLEDFGDAKVSAWPDWVTTIPTNPDRVTFTLSEPRPTTAPR